ncbi:MAG: glycosyltransferase family 2 protein [Bacteroidales bacterium]|nr:glycosyltransferase family 2 protein [Bacteroidales bacterium]
MEKITAIICVLNEEKTIRNVILSIQTFSIVNEIIVVNDGSTDNTEGIIKDLKQQIDIIDINLPKNKGKGYAMAVGVEYATNDIIVFVDADQIIIPYNYVYQMVVEHLRNKCNMTLGYSTANILGKEVNPLKILTGERVLFKKDIEPILNRMKESRFGVETLLYLYYISTGKSILYTRLYGLKHKNKYEKTSLIKATKNYINEGLEIAYTSIILNHDLLFKYINCIFSKYYRKIRTTILSN